MTIEEKVILLALLKKEEGESLREILLMLENSRVFTMKEGKRLARALKNGGFIKEGGELTFKGITAAESAEAEFKLS
ncbi:hypothetical protein [Hydrogenimonas urashimensis]|uniref:hypothetical protein n=1 Tax=Hydrogenimonas urashimensis TaxID=2740515 RepID=UPI0019160972|nr:hypothetical protein [Hydrogenimonas urashimensis]